MAPSPPGTSGIPYRTAAFANVLSLFDEKYIQSFRLRKLQRRKDSSRTSPDDNNVVVFFHDSGYPPNVEKAEMDFLSENVPQLYTDSSLL